MKVKRIFIICILFSGISSITYAADSVLSLGSTDSTSGFAIKDSTGTTVMRIGGDGNVGIGTATPGSKATIRLDTEAVSNDGLNTLRLERGDDGDNIGETGPQIVFAQRWWMGDPGTARTGAIRGIKTGLDGSFGGGLQFLYQPDNSGNNMNVGVTVTGAGNVGIGTTTPGTILDVTALNPHIRLSNNGGANAAQWDLWAYSVDGSLRVRNVTSGNVDRLTFQSDGGVIINGNVGIGTTSPQGKLDVNGTIYQRGSQLHADYVFEPDYALEPIREHADFMWKNKHLKGIPKAKVDENGMEIVEVGSHRKGIVEELEKAHIYIEQLHKQNKALEDSFEEVKAGNSQLKERLLAMEARQGVIEAVVFGGTDNKNEKMAMMKGAVR